MNKMFFALLLFAFAVYGQQKRIAIINTVDDGEPPVGHSELNHLTNRLREIAVKTLPEKNYGVMTQQSIVDFLGSQDDMARKCKESEGCLAKLGREINADYICQGRIGRFGESLAINVELYDVQKGNLVGSSTGSSKDIYGLLAVLDNEAPGMFRKMPGVSGIKTPAVVGGISGLQSAADYEFEDEKRYLANISTEPQGAALSFDGLPDDKCSRTPCKTERPEGDVRIIGRLEQYETADTTVSIKQNNQNVNIRLKPNFGVLEINPAYSEGIGDYEQWSLAINDSSYSFGEIRLLPGSYAVKLNHECYENISFTAGIHKDKREVFDMSGHVKLKKGGLVLRAERGGEPASELVFVDGQQVGETPFGGSVPLCSNIEIGRNREKVEVSLKHNDKVEHIVSETTEQRMERERLERLDRERLDRKRHEEIRKEEKGDARLYSAKIGFGVPFMLNSIDSTFNTLGLHVFLNLEYFKPKYDFFRIGWNLNVGSYQISKNAVRKIHPDVEASFNDMSYLINAGAFARLYPVSFMYLSGGSSFGRYGGYIGKTESGSEISGKSTWTVIFPVGGGLIFGNGSGTFIEALYNIAMLKKGYGAYWSFNIGFKGSPRQ